MFRLLQLPARHGGLGATVVQDGLQPMDDAVGARHTFGEEGLLAVLVE